MTYVIQTRQTQPVSSNMSPQQRAVGQGLVWAGHAVFVVDKFGRHWRWGNWKTPYAHTALQFEAKERNHA